MVVQGDSGGPLTVVDSSSERHTLVGLVSKRLIENQCNKVKHIISTSLVVSHSLSVVNEVSWGNMLFQSTHWWSKAKPNNAGVKVGIFFANVSLTICLMILSQHSLKLWFLSQRLASIQTLQTTSDGSRTRSRKIFLAYHIIIITRPYAALRTVGLHWIVEMGFRSGT